MPGSKHGPSVKDPEQYEALRDDGMSKQKAARIANASANEGRSKVGRRGGKGGAYEDACLSISHVGTAIGGCGNVGDDGHAEGDGGRAADGLEHP